jgi:hypothetical protein
MLGGSKIAGLSRTLESRIVREFRKLLSSVLCSIYEPLSLNNNELNPASCRRKCGSDCRAPATDVALTYSGSLNLTMTHLLYSRTRSRASTASMEHAIISFRNTSQYSSGGPSACGLASVNAVRTILTKFDGGESVRTALEQEETAMVSFSLMRELGRA